MPGPKALAIVVAILACAGAATLAVAKLRSPSASRRPAEQDAAHAFEGEQRAELAAPEWAEDGSVQFALDSTAEFGSAALHVYPARKEKGAEFVLKLDLRESPGYVGPPDAVVQNTLDLTFGFPDQELRCGAFGFSNPRPTESLRQFLEGGARLRTGGYAEFGPDSAAWREFTMTFFEEPVGTPVYAHHEEASHSRPSSPVSGDKEKHIAALLRSFRGRMP